MKAEYSIAWRGAHDILAFLYLRAPDAAKPHIEEVQMNLTALGIDIEIRNHRQKQTDEQRGYYWANLHAFGKHLGYTPSDCEKYLHEQMLMEAFGSRELLVVTTGEILRVPALRSSKAKRDEYSELIETLIRVAAEHEYVVEDPELYKQRMGVSW